MPNIVMLSVVMLNIFMLSVVKLSVFAPCAQCNKNSDFFIAAKPSLFSSKIALLAPWADAIILFPLCYYKLN
jgi:hypothetical protein